MYFDLHSVLIEIHLKNMSEYLDIVQSALEQKQYEFDTFIKSKAEILNNEDKGILHDKYGDDYWRLYDIFPEYLYNTFIISWYSFIETKLYDLCKFLEMERKLALEYKILKGEVFQEPENI